jgi:WD40 repeat protein
MKRQALVVGINQYPSHEDLPTPAADAEAVAQLLEKYGDFEVHRLPSQDGVRRVAPDKLLKLEELEEAIIRLFQPKSGIIPETALLFFAGHGLQRERDGETEGFLITSEARPGKDKGLFSLKRLRQLLQDSPVRQQIVWLDCCHSGELFNFTETDLGEEKRGRDRCFIAASREFQVAYGGVLTPALLQGLNPTNQPDGWVTNYTLKDFIEQALKDAPQHSACRNTGGQIILTGKQGVRGNICPYKGLEFFDFNPEQAENAEDPKYFYGRTKLTKQLLKKVRSSNFLAVLGASGSGKSSVVRAGLLYQLYLGEEIRGSDRWKIYKPFTPGEHPLRSLEQVVGVKAEQLEPIIKAAAAERVVLVVDQFEEVFTQCRDDAERQQFFQCLMGAVERLGNKLCLVLVMRDDFQHKCAEQDSKLTKKIDQNLVRVKQMSQEELREAITKPAEQVELEIDRELVNQIIADVSDSPGDLPLLQYTLTQLWEKYRFKRLTLSEYNYPDFGGVKKALENHANQVYQSLAIEQQKAAKRIFLELTRLGEDEQTPNTRQQVRQQDLVNLQQSEALVNQVVQHLAKEKLVVTSEQEFEGKRVAVVNIAHEALIRHWNLLREWLKENQETLRTKQDIEDAAKDWRDKGKPKDSAYLWQGSRLTETENFQQKYADTLPVSSVAQEFVEQSIEQRKSSHRRTAAIVTAVILGLSGLAAWVLVENENAQIRALSASSEALFASNNEFDALIVSLRAGRRLQQPLRTILVKGDTRIQVVMALQQAVYGVKERNRLEGLGDQLDIVSLSPNGQMIATSSKNLVRISDHDKTVKLISFDGTLLATLKGHSKAIRSVSFSPDSQTIASASEDNTIKLWRRDGTLLKTIKTSGVSGVSFSPNSQIIASVSKDNTIKLWSRNGTLYKTLTVPGQTINGLMAFSPDSQMIAVVSESEDSIQNHMRSTITLWSIDGTLLKTLEGHRRWIESVKFSPDGQRLVTGGWDSIVRLWSLDGTLLKSIEGGGRISDLSFSPDGEMIASATVSPGNGIPGLIKLWRSDGTLVKTLEQNSHTVTSVSFSPDSQMIASGGDDNVVKLWSRNGNLLKTFNGHRQSVTKVGFSSDGQMIASAGEDNTIRLWSVSGILPKTFKEYNFRYKAAGDAPVSIVNFSPNGQMIGSVSDDNTIKLWSIDGTLLKILDCGASSRGIKSISFSPDGQLIASGAGDKTIKLWSLDGTLLKNLEGLSNEGFNLSEMSFVGFSPDSQMFASVGGSTAKLWSRDGRLIKTLEGFTVLGFSPDSQTIASAAEDNTIKLWHKDGNLLKTLQGHNGGVFSISFSPDGQKIATASADRTIKLWHRDGRLIKTLQGHNGTVNIVSFSPDGQLIISADTEQTIKLWRSDGTLIKTLEGHNDFVNNVSFSPDSQIIASASSDKTVKLWSRNGTLIKTLEHSGSVNSLSFRPDGKTLATAVDDGTVLLWNLDLDDLLARGCTWARGYLENNSSISKEDRNLCKGVKPPQ